MIRIAQVTVSLERRELFAGSQPIKLGSRAFDILELLINARGQLVTKDELLARVWPHSVVEENNLQVHISMLRKVLGGGRDLIKTVPGRGYRLLLDDEHDSAPAALDRPPIDAALPTTEPTGRDHLLIALLERLGLQDMLDESRGQPSVVPLPAAEEPAGPWWQGSGVTVNTPLNSMDAVVYIVDDESSVRSALARLLRSAGVASKAFACAEDFLQEPYAEQLACLVLDVNLQASSGFDLQQELRRRGCEMPIIFMTGYGTIPMSVKAIKAGAQEFLTKPFDEGQLLEAVDNALAYARRTYALTTRTREIRRRFETLTPRERQVLALLITGRINKQIAHELGTREVTTKVHKKHIMTKMHAATLIELVQMCELIGFDAALQRPNVI
ncbi:MAG: response regulator [Janthinobacterium lividum]|jgi:FixJ family two-component response regulator/DNA-binding winged helix-turn-helix (wHTH) protein|uniref:response regulator n=1 Tax=Pseudomonas sp. MWU16-30317 TaxID=2878095 RepID=UPI001CFAD893|nr:response regulator [Pseudomonas sp. MWU16-30317]